MEHFHFVGVGGIGMSAAAAMCRDLGYRVSGSDRGAEREENRMIFDALRRQGIEIFPQDGSYSQAGKPDFLVYSSAIEEDNPDFVAGAGIPRLHRSEMLVRLMSELPERTLSVAVAGSCGKSTVTGYAAEALLNTGDDPGCLNGALSKRFAYGAFAGNYRPGRGKYFVFEADESDKSLLHYTPDYAIVLNIGTDHYSKAELAELFAAFLGRVRKGAVLERGVFEAVKGNIPPKLKISVFDAARRSGSDYYVSDYRVATKVESIYTRGRRSRLAYPGDRSVEDTEGASNLLSIYGMRSEDCRIERRVPLAEFNGSVPLRLPAPGFHTALNALAVFALLEMLGFDRETAAGALERFDGIRRRNDFIGVTPRGTLVYDDYAHNPEKIVSCLRALRELGTGTLFAVFQPHGFAPLRFMRDELYLALEKELRKGELFCLLPPYYAGGTADFSPTSEEVAADWKSRSNHPERFAFFPERDALRDFLSLKAGPGDIVAVMGARDNSLPLFARSFL